METKSHLAKISSQKCPVAISKSVSLMSQFTCSIKVNLLTLWQRQKEWDVSNREKERENASVLYFSSDSCYQTRGALGSSLCFQAMLRILRITSIFFRQVKGFQRTTLEISIFSHGNEKHFCAWFIMETCKDSNLPGQAVGLAPHSSPQISRLGTWFKYDFQENNVTCH